MMTIAIGIGVITFNVIVIFYFILVNFYKLSSIDVMADKFISEKCSFHSLLTHSSIFPYVECMLGSAGFNCRLFILVQLARIICIEAGFVELSETHENPIGMIILVPELHYNYREFLPEFLLKWNIICAIRALYFNILFRMCNKVHVFIYL